MSWEARVSNTKVRDAWKALEKAFQPQEGYGEEESKEAFWSTMDSLQYLLDAVTYTADDVVSIAFSGHSNPNHVPEGEWSRDFIYVAITRYHEESPVEED